MPYSDNKVRHALLSYLRRVGIPRVVLDIGPGAGFYGKALRSFRKDIEIYGVEIWETYIAKFKLNSIYDKVFCADTRVFDYSIVSADLVILADIVEHLSKSDAISVIRKLKKYYKWLLITIPIVRYEQEAQDDNPYEAHLYQWTKEEIVRDLGMVLMQDCGMCGLFEWREGLRTKKKRKKYAPSGFNFKIHFMCKGENGAVLDSSIGKQPVQFTIGQFQLIHELEAAMLGMFPGESKKIYITSEEANHRFGENNLLFDIQIIENN